VLNLYYEVRMNLIRLSYSTLHLCLTYDAEYSAVKQLYSMPAVWLLLFKWLMTIASKLLWPPVRCVKV